jgi:hypothetical protein
VILFVPLKLVHHESVSCDLCRDSICPIGGQTRFTGTVNSESKIGSFEIAFLDLIHMHRNDPVLQRCRNGRILDCRDCAAKHEEVGFDILQRAAANCSKHQDYSDSFHFILTERYGSCARVSASHATDGSVISKSILLPLERRLFSYPFVQVSKNIVIVAAFAT